MADIRYKHTRVFTSDWTDDLEWVAPGAMCVLVGHCGETDPAHKMWYTLQRGEGGVSGNLDWKCKRYHGWRGTTDNVGKYAYGLREVLAVDVISDDVYHGKTLRVTLSKDLRPEWE